MKNCETCSAWSELVAHCHGGPIEALCINPASPMHGKYMTGRSTCAEWSDDPALADHPSERAPGASPKGREDGRPRDDNMIAQLKEIFGEDNVVDMGRAFQPAAKGEWANRDRDLEDGRVERSATRKSAITGEVRTLVLTATAEQWAALDRGVLIQEAVAHLSLSDREFLMTGITDDEWNEAFPEEDEDAAGGAAPPDQGPAF